MRTRGAWQRVPGAAGVWCPRLCECGAGRGVVWLGAGRSVGSLGPGGACLPVGCVRADLLGSAWASGVRVGLCLRGPCELCGGLGTGRQVRAVRGRGCPWAGGGAQGQGQPGRGARAWATGVTGLTATGLRAVGCARTLLLPTVCVVPVDSGAWGRGLLSQPRGPASFPLPAPPRPLAGPRFPLNLLLRDTRPSAASSPTASDPGCRGLGEAAHCLRCGGVGAGWAEGSD